MFCWGPLCSPGFLWRFLLLFVFWTVSIPFPPCLWCNLAPALFLWLFHPARRSNLSLPLFRQNLTSPFQHAQAPFPRPPLALTAGLNDGGYEAGYSLCDHDLPVAACCLRLKKWNSAFSFMPLRRARPFFKLASFLSPFCHCPLQCSCSWRHPWPSLVRLT